MRDIDRGNFETTNQLESNCVDLEKMLMLKIEKSKSNYLAKFRLDTDENEHPRVCQADG